MDNGQCKDFNECSSNTHDCHVNGFCTNKIGYHECSCNSGYEGDGEMCTDIDECYAGHTCSVEASCSNVAGSYDCLCFDGYSGDGYNCQDNDECADDTTNACTKLENCENLGLFVFATPPTS